jgi:hypothetical protein
MPLPDHYIDQLKAEIAKHRSMLEPLETGRLRIGERRGNEPWRDITQARVTDLKRSIAVLQAIVDKRAA